MATTKNCENLDVTHIILVSFFLVFLKVPVCLELLGLPLWDTRLCEKQATQGLTETKPWRGLFLSLLPRGNLLTTLPDEV